MLIVDTILYGIIAWYLDKIMPSEYGTQLSWYFPVLPSYWLGVKVDFGNKSDLTTALLESEEEEDEEEEDEEYDEESGNPDDIMIKSVRVTRSARQNSFNATTRESLTANMAQNNINYEPVSGELKQLGREGRALKIRKLRKAYQTTSADRVAVDCLNLDMYEGQVTVLLGHNGAGNDCNIFVLMCY